MSPLTFSGRPGAALTGMYLCRGGQDVATHLLYHGRMRINADFSKPALVVPRAADWVKSPESGVERLMLDRIGDEVARATSLVRYAPGSSFRTHTHAIGEEFLVLDGVFSDENGDYPRGTYVRNPPGSSHAPRSDGGCRILVKLRQFDPADLTRVVVDTNEPSAWQERAAGSSRLPLHAFGDERVEMRRIDAGNVLEIDTSRGGAELLVVSGALDYEGRILGKESWLRLPHDVVALLPVSEAAVVWLKTGHLPPAMQL